MRPARVLKCFVQEKISYSLECLGAYSDISNQKLK